MAILLDRTKQRDTETRTTRPAHVLSRTFRRVARIGPAFLRAAAVLALWPLAPWDSATADRVDATLDLSAVRVEITWVESQPQMDALRREFGHTRVARSIRATKLRGFAVLGKRDGEHVCLLFVRKPKRVNDGATLILGHEVLHCLLGDYHAE